MPHQNLLSSIYGDRSSPPEVFLAKGVLKICTKITRAHLCRIVISINLLCNFIEITLRHGCSPVNLLHIFKTPFPKDTSEGLLLWRVKILLETCCRILIMEGKSNHVQPVNIKKFNSSYHRKIKNIESEGLSRRKGFIGFQTYIFFKLFFFYVEPKCKSHILFLNVTAPSIKEMETLI